MTGTRGCPPLRVQPLSADELAVALAEIAARPADRDIVEVAGPEELALDDLARRLSA
jgi:uncharacterized protein YbjT (DUF2867 family)